MAYSDAEGKVAPGPPSMRLPAPLTWQLKPLPGFSGQCHGVTAGGLAGPVVATGARVGDRGVETGMPVGSGAGVRVRMWHRLTFATATLVTSTVILAPSGKLA